MIIPLKNEYSFRVLVLKIKRGVIVKKIYS